MTEAVEEIEVDGGEAQHDVPEVASTEAVEHVEATEDDVAPEVAAPRPSWLNDIMNYRPSYEERQEEDRKAGGFPELRDSALDRETLDAIRGAWEQQQQTIQQLRDEIGKTRGTVDSVRAQTVDREIYSAADYLDREFYPNVIAADPEIMGNPAAMEIADRLAAHYMTQAVQIARYHGDPDRVAFVRSDWFRDLVIGGAKEHARRMKKAGGARPVDKPAIPRGAHTEGAASSAKAGRGKVPKEIASWLKDEGISEKDYLENYAPFMSDVAYDGDE